jgi:hypothetical protein
VPAVGGAGVRAREQADPGPPAGEFAGGPPVGIPVEKAVPLVGGFPVDHRTGRLHGPRPLGLLGGETQIRDVTRLVEVEVEPVALVDPLGSDRGPGHVDRTERVGDGLVDPFRERVVDRHRPLLEGGIAREQPDGAVGAVACAQVAAEAAGPIGIEGVTLAGGNTPVGILAGHVVVPERDQRGDDAPVVERGHAGVEGPEVGGIRPIEIPVGEGDAVLRETGVVLGEAVDLGDGVALLGASARVALPLLGRRFGTGRPDCIAEPEERFSVGVSEFPPVGDQVPVLAETARTRVGGGTEGPARIEICVVGVRPSFPLPVPRFRRSEPDPSGATPVVESGNLVGPAGFVLEGRDQIHVGVGIPDPRCRSQLQLDWLPDARHGRGGDGGEDKTRVGPPARSPPGSAATPTPYGAAPSEETVETVEELDDAGAAAIVGDGAHLSGSLLRRVDDDSGWDTERFGACLCYRRSAMPSAASSSESSGSSPSYS